MEGGEYVLGKNGRGEFQRGNRVGGGAELTGRSGLHVWGADKGVGVEMAVIGTVVRA